MSIDNPLLRVFSRILFVPPFQDAPSKELITWPDYLLDMRPEYAYIMNNQGFDLGIYFVCLFNHRVQTSKRSPLPLATLIPIYVLSRQVLSAPPLHLAPLCVYFGWIIKR